VREKEREAVEGRECTLARSRVSRRSDRTHSVTACAIRVCACAPFARSMWTGVSFTCPYDDALRVRDARANGTCTLLASERASATTDDGPRCRAICLAKSRLVFRRRAAASVRRELDAAAVRSIIL